jgi:hypothetical protein
MRAISVCLLFLLLVAFALPAAAQAKGTYKPVSDREATQLRELRTPGLEQLRGGEVVTRRGLTDAERAAFKASGIELPEGAQVLRGLRAGRHGHGGVWWDNWVWYFLVPGCATTVVVIVLVLVILLI